MSYQRPNHYSEAGRDPELTQFYKSRAWKRVRKLKLLSTNYLCERCGQPAVIVHHRTYLTPTNYQNPSLSLSLDNLESLCRECHNREHFSAAGPEAEQSRQQKRELSENLDRLSSLLDLLDTPH